MFTELIKSCWQKVDLNPGPRDPESETLPLSHKGALNKSGYKSKPWPPAFLGNFGKGSVRNWGAKKLVT